MHTLVPLSPPSPGGSTLGLFLEPFDLDWMDLACPQLRMPKHNPSEGSVDPFFGKNKCLLYALLCNGWYIVKTSQVEWGAGAETWGAPAQAPQPEDQWVSSGAEGAGRGEQREDVLGQVGGGGDPRSVWDTGVTL